MQSIHRGIQGVLLRSAFLVNLIDILEGRRQAVPGIRIGSDTAAVVCPDDAVQEQVVLYRAKVIDLGQDIGESAGYVVGQLRLYL